MALQPCVYEQNPSAKLSGLEISFVGVRIELTQQVCFAAVPRIPVAMAMTLGHTLKTERASSQSY